MRKAALVALILSACGGPGKAVPAEVEIEWPDAAIQYTRPPPDADAGTKADAGTPRSDALDEPYRGR